MPEIQDMHIQGMKTLQWLLPETLDRCIDGYMVKVKSSNFTKIVWETLTQLPLHEITRHSIHNFCHADKISVIPHIRLHQYMPSSQASVVIPLGKTYLQYFNLLVITFTRVSFLESPYNEFNFACHNFQV